MKKSEEITVDKFKLSSVNATKIVSAFRTELVKLEELKPHPLNYKKHSDEELAHIAASLKEHGFYKNIIIAKDNVILAGHGVVAASKRIGFVSAPVVRLNMASDSEQALKVLVSDNEIAGLSENDDRMLADILQGLAKKDASNLFGTGFDYEKLVNLVFVTRPESEIQTPDEAAEWAGMPEYLAGKELFFLVVKFETEKEREDYVDQKKIVILAKTKKTWSTNFNGKRRSNLDRRFKDSKK